MRSRIFRQPTIIHHPVVRTLSLMFAVVAFFNTSIESSYAQSRSRAKAPIFNCQGRIVSLVEDYLLENREVFKYEVRCGRERLKLNLDHGHPVIPHDSIVKVSARRKKGSRDLGVSAADSQTSVQIVSQPSTQLSGTRSALIIRISSLDGGVSCSETALAGSMWSNPISVKSAYQTSSYGALTFLPDGDSNGRPDVVSVSIPYNTAGQCDYSTWEISALSAASKLVSLAPFQHLMFVLPSNINCGWGGLANIGGPKSYYNGAYCSWQPELFQHELGHNLGLGHSGTPSGGTYADHSCAMGNPTGPVTFGAAKRDEMNWLPAGNVATVPGTYRISNLLKSPNSNELSAVKLPRGTAGGSLFVAYRQKDNGDESGLTSVYDRKITVTIGDGLGSMSSLAATLVAGQSHLDTASGYTVSVLAIDPVNQVSEVVISQSCSHISAALSISPATIVTNSPTPQVFDVTITNQDTLSCPASAFTLSAQIPAIWSTSIPTPTFSLLPGQSATAQVNVSPASNTTGGLYSITMDASRNSGPGASEVGYLLVDPIAPLPPTSVTTSIVGRKNKPKGVNVSCAGASDIGNPISGVVGHRMYRNGSFVCEVNGWSCIDPITTAGKYRYRCAAVDAAGNISPRSSASSTIVLAPKGD